MQDFLFTPDRARQPAKFLSGGERNRLLLARLFRQSSNVLVLDEPTNDLDTETLELLEELVSSYSGTLLLVSHDRAFLNNVVTSILALDGDGHVVELGGGYDDYARFRARQTEQADDARNKATKPAAKNEIPVTADKKNSQEAQLQRAEGTGVPSLNASRWPRAHKLRCTPR